MKRVVFFIMFAVVFQVLAKSQYANPFISMNMTPGKILLTKFAILEVQAGNAGNDPIQPNSLTITINAGINAEITGIREDGSDKRWTIQSLDKGKGNTIVLVNAGKSPFNAFDLGRIYVLFKGTSSSEKPVAVFARIAYTKNSEQGNTSSQDDITQTSLWVSSGSAPLNSTKTTPVVIPEKQDLDVSSNGCEAILSWKVNDKKKVEGIEVEYSKNGSEFSKLGEATLKDGGNPGEYEYKYDQGNGKGYYRLRLAQTGNSIEYSKIKEITTKCIIRKGF